MKSIDLVKSILQTFPGEGIRSVINLVNEIIEEHGDDLKEGRTIEPFGSVFQRELELEYTHRSLCTNCSGDDNHCHLCGGTMDMKPPETRYVRIWLSDMNGGELCWG